MHVRGGPGEKYLASSDLKGKRSCMMCSLVTQVILSYDPVQPSRPKLGVLHCRRSRGAPFRHRKRAFPLIRFDIEKDQ